MKTKTLSIILFAGLFLLAVSSCNRIVVSTNEKRMDKFEKAIDNVSENYKTMTPEKLTKAVQKCDKFKEELQDEGRAYTAEQFKRVDKLCSRYWWVRLKVTNLGTMSADDIEEAMP